MTDQHLRPIERTVRRLRQEGQSTSEVAWRLRRSPRYVERVLAMSDLPRSSTGPLGDPDTPALRPIERCVLEALQSGSGYPEIAARLRRTPGYVSRVEELANLKLERSAGP